MFATAADRRSRFFVAAYAGRKTKDAVGAALRRCRTLTFDNGPEFAGHVAVGEALGAETYFADPYSSWQRGTNEWLNGRLRRHFPKGTPLLGVTDAALQSALDKINSKPMKVLGWRTPHEAYYGVSQKLTRICTRDLNVGYSEFKIPRRVFYFLFPFSSVALVQCLCQNAICMLR